MKTVKDILKTKGSAVIVVNPEAGVIEALEIMAQRNIGAILVLSLNGDLAGIFSERDFARKIILKGYSCESSKVREMMTTNIVCAEPATTIADCMKLMTDNHFRHLPIKENGKVVGVVSIGDVVKALIQEKEQTISEQAFEIGQKERLSTSAI